MSDLFSGLTGVRFPDARINGGGPLPTELSGPAGINGDPDGRINFNDSLLSNLTPYQFEPGTGRMGSDRNYQQIPHRRQYFIPKLWLPRPDGMSKFALSHGVDQGDIAFVLPLRQKAVVLYEKHAPAGTNDYVNVDVFCNLATANYILRGLHEWHKCQGNAENPQTQPNLWGSLYNEVLAVTREWNPLKSFIPFGICAGSEKQGGLHETGLAPVQAACSHITTMTLDGQSRDLVNFWQNCNIVAGDVLIFRLKMKEKCDYTLNHYYKGVVSQKFPKPTRCPQIVPDIYSCCPPTEVSPTEVSPTGLSPTDVSPIDEKTDYIMHGFWRVAQSFTSKRKFRTEDQFSNDTMFLQGQLLQVTFAPVWIQYCHEWCANVATQQNTVQRVGFYAAQKTNALALCGKVSESIVETDQSAKVGLHEASQTGCVGVGNASSTTTKSTSLSTPNGTGEDISVVDLKAVTGNFDGVGEQLKEKSKVRKRKSDILVYSQVVED